MALFNFHANRKSRSNIGKSLPLFEQWLSLLETFFYSTSDRTRSAPHIRSFANVQGLLNNFVIATIPCWLIGLWNLGYQSNLAIRDLEIGVLPGWRGELIGLLGIGHNPGNVLACFFHGLLYFAPIFLVALLVASIWEVLFSTLRQRPQSEGLLVFCWLFTMVMPAGVDLYQVGLGVSFGFVIGSAIYGGVGRYLVNPALLGVTFLLFAYPDLVFGPDSWIPVPGAEMTPVLKLAATGGISAVQSAGYSWQDLFLGLRPGSMGTVSVLGCCLGAIYLVLTDSISWRILSGIILGMWTAVMLFNGMASEINPLASIPWSWHLVLGGFAFGAIFFATDPVPAATTLVGRWLFGILVGVLSIVIRVSNPSYNEGVLFAILLASLFSPMIDFVVIELNIRRRRRRLHVEGK